jgi:Prp8 binding protein
MERKLNMHTNVNTYVQVSMGPGRLQYKLPGHTGSVNDCAFHPTQPIIASASSDKTLFLGELMQ